MINKEEGDFRKQLAKYGKTGSQQLQEHVKVLSILFIEDNKVTPDTIKEIFKDVFDKIARHIISTNPQYDVSKVKEVVELTVRNYLQAPQNLNGSGLPVLTVEQISDNVEQILPDWKPALSFYGDYHLVKGDSYQKNLPLNEAKLNKSLDYLLAAEYYIAFSKSDTPERGLFGGLQSSKKYIHSEEKFKEAYNKAHASLMDLSNNENSQSLITRFNKLTDQASKVWNFEEKKISDVLPKNQQPKTQSSSQSHSFFKPDQKTEQQNQLLTKVDAQLLKLQKDMKTDTTGICFVKIHVLQTAKSYLKGDTEAEVLQECMAQNPEYKQGGFLSSKTSSLVDDVIKMRPFAENKSDLKSDRHFP